jgi:hypothetical protein
MMECWNNGVLNIQAKLAPTGCKKIEIVEVVHGKVNGNG